MGKPRLIALAVWAAVLLGALVAAPGHASAKTAQWLNYDVTVTVNDDGSFHVAEKQEVQFSGGAFHFGYRDIKTGLTEGVQHLKITEITAAGSIAFKQVDASAFTQASNTFATTAQAGALHVEYGFDHPADGTRTFVLEYDALGALRVYANETPPNEQVYWTAIDPALTKNGDVKTATVTVILPKAVAIDSVVLGQDATGPAAQHTTDGQTWVWTKANLGAGDQFVVRIQFPLIVNVGPPSWQAADDRSRADAANRDHRNSLIETIGMAILGVGLTGGGVGLYRLWYTRGRDPQVPAVAQYLSEPPDGLSPALVGTLVAERAGNPQLVAMMIDLARRGFFEIQNTSTDGASTAAADFKLVGKAHTETPSPAERALLTAIFSRDPDNGAFATMADARKRIAEAASAIKTSLDRELTAAAYFPSSPEKIRGKWGVAGGAVLVGGFLCPLSTGMRG